MTSLMSSQRTLEACLFILMIAVGGIHAIQLQVLHEKYYRAYDDTDTPLNVRFFVNDTKTMDITNAEMILAMNLSVTVKPWTEEKWHLKFYNETITFSANEIVNGANKTFVFWSAWWGYFQCHFYGTGTAMPYLEVLEQQQSENHQEDLEVPRDDEVRDEPAEAYDDKEVDDHVHHHVHRDVDYEQDEMLPDEQWKLLNNETIVVIDRKPSSQIVDTIVVASATTFMLINTVNMGCQLDLSIIWGVLKKPIGPLCGVVTQFFCMPLFSFTIGYFLLDDPLQRLGLFTLGCSPGGNVSNFWTLLFHGDINLSITMTFCSTIIAMGMMPFWMATLGKRLISDSPLKVPFFNLIMSLIMLSIPIGIGLLIKYKKESWAQISKKIVKPMTFCMITFFITVGIYNNYKSFGLMTWNVVIAGLCVSMAGYAAGASLAAICCLKRPQIIAISIETAFQNAAIAFILLKISLPTPDSDLATVPVLAQMVQTGPPLIVIYCIWQACQKFCGICIPEDVIDEQGKKEAGDEESAEGTTKRLMELSEVSTPTEEAPRTPGLLYDPSIAEELKNTTA